VLTEVRYQTKDEGIKEIMMKKVSAVALALAVLMIITAPVAQATTVSEVQTMITQLKEKVKVIVITGKQAETKDRPGLLGQLDGVSLTLDQGKFCDSVTKVRDFQKKVTDMISANKLNQDPAVGPTGQQLLDDGDAIIKALNDLAVQSNGSPCSN
jgi:cell division protein FtsX